MEKPYKYTSVDDAVSKLQAYCVYQDRCHSEVRKKLISLRIFGADLEDVVTELITDGYLDEERFARSYARGKFRINRWGRVKIKLALKQKQVSDYCIRKGLTEIGEEEYLETLYYIISKKTRLENFENLSYSEKRKITSWAMSRGYELALILELLN